MVQGLSLDGHFDGCFSGSSKRLLNRGPDLKISVEKIVLYLHKEMLSGNYQTRQATVSDISAYVMNGGARWMTGHGTRKAVTAAAAAGVDEEYGDDFPALILQVGKRRHRRRRRGRRRGRRMDNSLPLA